MKNRINQLSTTQQGFKRSRLPTFTQAEINSIRGSADFLGLNHYGSVHCIQLANQNDYETPSHIVDTNAECYPNEDWEETAAPWYVVHAGGLRSILNWIRTNYGNPEVIITENGYASSGENLHDCNRVNYMNVSIKSRFPERFVRNNIFYIGLLRTTSTRHP